MIEENTPKAPEESTEAPKQVVEAVGEAVVEETATKPDKPFGVELQLTEVDPASADHFTVIATNPMEMAHSQVRLMEWAVGALGRAKTALLEREESLTHARKSKLRIGPWKKLVNEAMTTVFYYEKMVQALRAGYFIVPEFPMSIIAVRTANTSASGSGVMPWRPDIAPALHALPQLLPEGKGHYVAPNLRYVTHVVDVGTKEKPRTENRYDIIGFNPVDMPLRLVKPQILRDLNKALQTKLFDDIGILPMIQNGKAVRSNAASKRKPDPMLFGRLHRRVGSSRVAVTFLISWWIDTATL